ncbi:MAG: hypothetical protein HY852_16550 [Bradyrhizobium sp.]|uniref:hypothetical protein n=1 Tax=Bradyrhizobium sp. TaxID=376 RepID=UPI0025C2C666|nr:hypothetical protein [Bradyrhizobium sp.]MBI5263421.1 hypothetical protein [Bradyrhizobium sp.]
MISVVGLAVLTTMASSAQEGGRIKRAPPTPAEKDRIASEMALNDSLLQRGDIIATDRGFVIFRGLAPDGMTADVAPIPNPLRKGSMEQKSRR